MKIYLLLKIAMVINAANVPPYVISLLSLGNFVLWFLILTYYFCIDWSQIYFKNDVNNRVGLFLSAKILFYLVTWSMRLSSLKTSTYLICKVFSIIEYPNQIFLWSKEIIACFTFRRKVFTIDSFLSCGNFVLSSERDA